VYGTGWPWPGFRQPQFENFEYKSASDGTKHFLKQKVAYNASHGGLKRFKYIISASDETEVHILDPEIIVPRPRG
jgi:hypothetical protein